MHFFELCLKHENELKALPRIAYSYTDHFMITLTLWFYWLSDTISYSEKVTDSSLDRETLTPDNTKALEGIYSVLQQSLTASEKLFELRYFNIEALLILCYKDNAIICKNFDFYEKSFHDLEDNIEAILTGKRNTVITAYGIWFRLQGEILDSLKENGHGSYRNILKSSKLLTNLPSMLNIETFEILRKNPYFMNDYLLGIIFLMELQEESLTNEQAKMIKTLVHETLFRTELDHKFLCETLKMLKIFITNNSQNEEIMEENCIAEIIQLALSKLDFCRTKFLSFSEFKVAVGLENAPKITEICMKMLIPLEEKISAGWENFLVKSKDCSKEEWRKLVEEQTRLVSDAVVGPLGFILGCFDTLNNAYDATQNTQFDDLLQRTLQLCAKPPFWLFMKSSTISNIRKENYDSGFWKQELY